MRTTTDPLVARELGWTGGLLRRGGRGSLVVVLVALAAFVAPAASATPAPPANFTFASIGPGGGFDGGTDLSGPDELVGTADDTSPLGAGNYGGLINGPVLSNGGPAVDSSFYCIDLTVNISPGQVQTVGSWNAALTDILPGGRTNSLTAANLAIIARIITNNYPSPDTLAPLTGSDDDKALAVQWAIWHYSNGYTPGTALATFTLGGLGTFDTTPANVDANYATILAAVAADTYPAVPEPEIPHLDLLAPPSTTAAAGGSLVGPYTVSAVSGVDVSATPDGDGVIVDAAGNPLPGPFHDGDQFYVRKPTAGTVTVTLGANEALPIAAALTDPGFQRLINAVAVVTKYTATATADFTGPLTPSIRVEKYDGTQPFTPNPAVATVDKDTDRPTGDADTLATAITGDPAAATPVEVTLNNNGTAPLYDVTVSDQTTAGTGTITGLECTFPDSSTGLFFAGPLDVGGVITCTGSLPALGFSASHVDQVTVFGRPGIFVGGEPAPDAGNPPTGTPITTAGPDVVTDQDLFTVITPAAPRYAIGDFVFFDTNANGVQDAGDTPVENVTVTLKDSGGATVATTTTDANGAYHFDDLLAGDYTVVFTAPSGQVFTTQTAGSDTTIDSNPNAAGISATLTLGPSDTNLTPSVAGDGVTAPQIDRTIDAGLIPARYAIGDYVFFDTNANGVQDAGDTPVENVTVTLKDSGGATIATTTTDANGAYHFDDLLAGDYTVVFTAPAGQVFTTQTAGSDTTIDSNPNAAGISATLTLGPSDTNLTLSVAGDGVTAPFIDRTVDAGLVPTRYAIGDYVFLDANANGVQDAGDTPVGNVTVTLRDSGGATVATTTTDANGAYHFDDLLAGVYRVDFTAPAGYSFTSQTVGSDTTIDSNPNSSGVSATFTLGQSDTNLTPSVPFDLVTAPFIDRTIDAGLTLSPSNPSVRVEKYDGTKSFTPNGAVATAVKDTDAPLGDAESPATALSVVGTDPTPVKVTLNNNGDVPLYDVTVADQTIAGTGTVTGLSCTFPDSSTGLFFAGPLVPGGVVTCTGTLPALGDAATHEDQVTIFGRAGLLTAGIPTPDPTNPPTGQPITGPGTGIVTDTDLFNVDTPAATTTTTTTTIPDTTTTTIPDTTTTTLPDTTTTTTVPDTTTTTTVPDTTTTTTVPDTTTTTTVPDTTTTTVPDTTTTTTLPGTTTTTTLPVPSNPSVRVEKYDGTKSFTPNGAVATAVKDTDAPLGDAESPATALSVVGTDPTPVKVTLNNNGDVPLYDVTVADQTIAGTGTVTGLSCTFPDSSTGLFFAGPLVPGAVVTCTGTLPALGDSATHEDQVTVLGRPGRLVGGVSSPDPSNPPTGQPITGPGSGIVTDTDLFNVDTPAATTTTTTTLQTTTTTVPDSTTTIPDTTTTTVPDTTTTTIPDTTTTAPETTTTTTVPETTTTVPETTTTVPETTTTLPGTTTTSTTPGTTTTVPQISSTVPVETIPATTTSTTEPTPGPSSSVPETTPATTTPDIAPSSVSQPQESTTTEVVTSASDAGRGPGTQSADLARTGAELGSMLAFGAGLVLVGVALTRRRRRFD